MSTGMTLGVEISMLALPVRGLPPSLSLGCGLHFQTLIKVALSGADHLASLRESDLEM